MSAFMHSTAHVDAIIHGALSAARGAIYYSNPAHDVRDNPTEAGRVLMRENAESMAFRYNMKDLDNDADGGTRPIEYLGYVEQAEGYEYDPHKPRKVYSIGELLLALDSLEYQSCEHPEWAESAAHGLCQSIRNTLIQALPEYASAQTWAIYDTEEARA